MDPLLQAFVTLGVALGGLAFGALVVVPLLDRMADRWERRHRLPRP